MFYQPVDERLSSWLEFRRCLEDSDTPLEDVQKFWNNAPFIPYNRRIDPFHKSSWPTPWEILQTNQYDDFTKSLMMGWTLKLTKKFKDSLVEIKTAVDKDKHREYNLVYIDNKVVLNFSDDSPVTIDSIPGELYLKNMVVLDSPR